MLQDPGGCGWESGQCFATRGRALCNVGVDDYFSSWLEWRLDYGVAAKQSAGFDGRWDEGAGENAVETWQRGRSLCAAAGQTKAQATWDERCRPTATTPKSNTNSISTSTSEAAAAASPAEYINRSINQPNKLPSTISGPTRPAPSKCRAGAKGATTSEGDRRRQRR
jgi:hypothetical protein